MADTPADATAFGAPNGVPAHAGIRQGEAEQRFRAIAGWDKNRAPPPPPADVVERTRQKYLEAYQRLTGKPLGPE